MATGATYRLSLLGALTSPLVFLLQASALLMPMPVLEKGVSAVNPWLEFHAAVSVVAYGAFALAGIAGVMLLVQERQLKTHKLHSFFFHLPPIHDLATANRRLLYFGFALLTAGLLSGLRQGMAHVNLLRVVSISIWLLYAFLCIALGVRRIAPRRASWLAIGAFAVLLLTVWVRESMRMGKRKSRLSSGQTCWLKLSGSRLFIFNAGSCHVDTSQQCTLNAELRTIWACNKKSERCMSIDLIDCIYHCFVPKVSRLHVRTWH